MDAISSGFSFTVLSVYLGGRDAGGAQIAAAQGPLMAARVSLVANATRMIWDHLARVSSLGE
jgi:hypothetical protein